MVHWHITDLQCPHSSQQRVIYSYLLGDLSYALNRARLIKALEIGKWGTMNNGQW